MRSKQCAKRGSKEKSRRSNDDDTSPIKKNLKHGMLHVPVKKKIEKKKNVSNLNKEKEEGENIEVGKNAVKEVKKDPSKSDFTCQSRPMGLCKLIRTFTEKQKDDVRSIGFGGLLYLDIIRCSNHHMLKWLVNNFNSSSRMLSIDSHRSFAITADDVYEVFMLPRNEGNCVPKYARNANNPLPPLLERFKTEYNIVAGAPVKRLVDVLNTLTDGGDDFKRIFVYFALSSFLIPTSNNVLTTMYLKSVEDVNMISTFDWCTLVLDKLCEAIKLYQKNNLKNITGCILLLQIVYFHRLRWRGFIESSNLPLIQHWNDKKIATRCTQELEAGEYGSGELILAQPSLKSKIIGDDEEKKKKKNEKDIVEGIATPEILGDVNLSQDVKEFLVSFKKDAKEFNDKYISRLIELTKSLKPTKDKPSDAPLDSTPVLSDTQKFFSDPSLHKAIDRYIENFMISQQLLAEMPSFELLSPERVNLADYGLADVELGLDDIGTDVNFFEAVEAGDEQVDEAVPDEELSSALNSVGHKKKNVVEDHLDEFFNITEDRGYVSLAMNYKTSIFQGMLQPHKEIADYCLCEYEGLQTEDDIFSYGKTNQQKTNFFGKDLILTMCPGKWISISVVQAWCLIINNQGPVEGKRSRFVFNLEHCTPLLAMMNGAGDIEENCRSLHKFWDQWLSESDDTLNAAELIFLPFWYDSHYAAVVINFVDKKAQYLDNRRYTNEENVYFLGAKILIAQMAAFLESKGHPKAKDVLTYNFENVKFKWQTTKVDDDCGVYLMHHLKNFDGSVYTSPDMTKALIVRVLRAEICASIVLSDINEKKSEVLERVYAFYKNKKELIKHIEDEKKKQAARVIEEKKLTAIERKKKRARI